MIIISFVMIGD